MSLVLLFRDVVHLCMPPRCQRLNLWRVDVTRPLTDLILESQAERVRTPRSPEQSSRRQLTEHRFGRAAAPPWNLGFTVFFKGTLAFLCAATFNCRMYCLSTNSSSEALQQWAGSARRATKLCHSVSPSRAH